MRRLLYGERSFALIFTLLYALLLAWLMQFHELWFDETEPWLLGLYSDSYNDLLYNKRYEGHPNLWYSILYLVTRFTHNVQALKVTQFVFAVGFVFVFLRYAPFHWLVRLLFCFGYYGLFEFGIISRLYAMEMFIMFSICALYPKRFSHWWLYMFLLAIIAQTHLFGFMFSGALGLLLFSEVFGFWKNVPQHQVISLQNRWIGVLLLSFACALSFWSMIRPEELDAVNPSRVLMYSTGQAFTLPGRVFFPIPQFQLHFWNTTFLRSRYTVPLSIGIISLLIYCFRTVPQLLLTLLMLFAGLFAFFIFKYEGFMRHFAHFFLFTLSIAWILYYYHSLPKYSSSSFSVLQKLLLLATFSQVLIGCYALYMDIRHIFIPAKTVAEYLIKLPYDFVPVTNDEVTASTVVAYLGYPVIDLTKVQPSSFFTPGSPEYNGLGTFQLLNWARALAQRRKQPVILITPHDINYMQYSYPVKHLITFNRNYILAHPPFYLYQIDYLPLPKADFVGGNVIVAEEPLNNFR